MSLCRTGRIEGGVGLARTPPIMPDSVLVAICPPRARRYRRPALRRKETRSRTLRPHIPVFLSDYLEASLIRTP